jgi:oligo-alginate lyase
MKKMPKFTIPPFQKNKEESTFFYKSVRTKVKQYFQKTHPSSNLISILKETTGYWINLCYSELWELMFPPTLSRSWMVFSNGFCPSCNESVQMYNWIIDPISHPWKVQCPHCFFLFPTNDFYTYYRSGLDQQGVFRKEQADKSMLVNPSHPDPKDPLHSFGVDDGDGYQNKDNQWRFIGAYLIYGQWKKLVLEGIRRLAALYVITGEEEYAMRGFILLHRVADFYPEFDFASQGYSYEKQGSSGYVSTWHDACEETRELALAYDMIYDGIQEEQPAVQFLLNKRSQNNPNPEDVSLSALKSHIEKRILRDALAHTEKIWSNQPRQPNTVMIILSVLSWDEHVSQIQQILSDVITQLTLVDGVTGEKGISSYAAFVIQSFANIIMLFSIREPHFINSLVKRFPKIIQTYTFHLDTWCLEQYYPLVGDADWIGKSYTHYQGVQFIKTPTQDGSHVFNWLAHPSMFTFLWLLYKASGDIRFAQTIYKANDYQYHGLFHDPYHNESCKWRVELESVINKHGKELGQASVVKRNWQLGILRSGRAQNRRATWITYEASTDHGHMDALNLGIFAYQHDIVSDFGYPPVQFGGWQSEAVQWYQSTLAHNTVVIDDQNQIPAKGKLLEFSETDDIHVIHVANTKAVQQSQYDRQIILIDFNEDTFYVVDIFRVTGGTKHDKWLHTNFADVNTHSLDLQPSHQQITHPFMRNFRSSKQIQPGWQFSWELQEGPAIQPYTTPLFVHYTDLTYDVFVATCEAWISPEGFVTNNDVWIPRLLVRRTGDLPLQSCFVGIIEVGTNPKSNIHAIRNVLPMVQHTANKCYPMDTKIEIEWNTGQLDMIYSKDIWFRRTAFHPPHDDAMEQNTNSVNATNTPLSVNRTNAAGIQTQLFPKLYREYRG